MSTERFIKYSNCSLITNLPDDALVLLNYLLSNDMDEGWTGAVKSSSDYYVIVMVK